MEGRSGLTIAPGGLAGLLSALISVQAEGSTWTHPLQLPACKDPEESHDTDSLGHVMHLDFVFSDDTA